MFHRLAALTVTFFLMGIVAFNQAAEANRQRMMAERQREIAAKLVELAERANLSAASAISPDGKRMLRVDPDLTIINLETLADSGRIKTDEGSISAATFSPDSKRVLVGTATGSIILYESETQRPVAASQGHADAIRRLAFGPDGHLFASGSDDATVRIWSSGGGREIYLVRLQGPVIGLSFDPAGMHLIVTSENGVLSVVDLRTGTLLP